MLTFEYLKWAQPRVLYSFLGYISLFRRLNDQNNGQLTAKNVSRSEGIWCSETKYMPSRAAAIVTSRTKQHVTCDSGLLTCCQPRCSQICPEISAQRHSEQLNNGDARKHDRNNMRLFAFFRLATPELL